MPGSDRGPTGEPDMGDGPDSRRLTPSIGLSSAPDDSDTAMDGESNEDFLFHLYRGSELLQDDRAHEAKEELERALRLQPQDTKGQDLLAVVYFRLGQFPRAIAIYEQLRRKNPKDTAILLNLALCYLKTGQPTNAKRDLEQLVAVNPAHTRAWGYLGLACERLGDLGQAQRAFEQGGHAQMASRIAGKRASIPIATPAPGDEAHLPEPVRDVVAAAFEELDAGELSFELAGSDEGAQDDASAQSWRPVELGHRRDTALGLSARGETEKRADTEKPDTKDGPPRVLVDSPAIHHAPSPPSVSRRPTLIAPAPPAPNLADLERFINAQAPHPEDSIAPPSIRRPVVAVPPVRPHATNGDAPLSRERFQTLPPTFMKPESAPPPSMETLAHDSVLPFPHAGEVVIHPSGVALVRTGRASSFAARVESIRVSSHTQQMSILERHAKGKPTGEAFGGLGSPVAHIRGEGQLVLGPRAGRKISSFLLRDETCFAREEVLLGFDGELVFENGRLATGDGDFVGVVQLRGKGAVLLEAVGETLTLEVAANRAINVRREVVLGWFGRLVPRVLPAGEAPCGQRGLVSFAGEGRVLVSGT